MIPPNNDDEPQGPENLDLTSEGSISQIDLVQPRMQRYDPAYDRERVRMLIAGFLLFSVLLFMTGSFLGLVFRKLSIEEFREFINSIFGPIMTLLSAVSGFYFGERSSRG
jgi:hypothetical protein